MKWDLLECEALIYDLVPLAAAFAVACVVAVAARMTNLAVDQIDGSLNKKWNA